MRITSNKEKYLRRNGNKNLQCIVTPAKKRNDDKILPCYINKQNTTSCGFCGSNDTGENISNCNKQTKYRRDFCEYVVSKSDEGNTYLINCLRHYVTLSSQTYPDSVVSMSVETNRGKHIVIYNVWMKQQVQPFQRLISNMLFKISYINKQGEIETLRRTVCGEDLSQ